MVRSPGTGDVLAGHPENLASPRPPWDARGESVDNPRSRLTQMLSG